MPCSGTDRAARRMFLRGWANASHRKTLEMGARIAANGPRRVDTVAARPLLRHDCPSRPPSFLRETARSSSPRAVPVCTPSRPGRYRTSTRQPCAGTSSVPDDASVTGALLNQSVKAPDGRSPWYEALTGASPKLTATSTVFDPCVRV